MNVFISSTYIDCLEYRKAAIEIVKSLKDKNLNLIGMELFGSRTETTLDVCLNEVRKSDIYILIVAHRYGTVDIETKKSYTQLEYEEVQKLGIPILIYLLDDKVPVLPAFIDKDGKYKKLQKFKAVLAKNHTYSNFMNSRELKVKLYSDLCRELKIENINYEKIDLNKMQLTPDIYNYREYNIDFIIDFSKSRDAKIEKINSHVIYKLKLHEGNSLGINIKFKTNNDYVGEYILICQNFYINWLRNIIENRQYGYYDEETEELKYKVYNAKVRFSYCLYMEYDDFENIYNPCEFYGFELLEEPTEIDIYTKNVKSDFIWWC